MNEPMDNPSSNMDNNPDDGLSNNPQNRNPYAHAENADAQNAQTPQYFDAPDGNPYSGNGYFYARYTANGQPNGSQPNNGSWQSTSPFRLMEEWLPTRAKNAIRGAYGLLGIAAILLGLALLIWPGATLKVAAIALGLYFVARARHPRRTAARRRRRGGAEERGAVRRHACRARHHGGRPRLDDGGHDGSG